MKDLGLVELEYYPKDWGTAQLYADTTGLQQLEI